MVPVCEPKGCLKNVAKKPHDSLLLAFFMHVLNAGSGTCG